MSAPRSAPTVLQMVLGRRLQELRRAKGLSSQEVGAMLRQAHTTVIRMEQAKVALKWATVKAMLEIYGVDEAEAEEFLALTDQANEPGWWQSYRDALPSWFAVHVSLENSATHIRGYEPHVVPGLLQTEDYARDVLRLNRPRPTPEELERRVALRLERQALLTRQDPAPPQLWITMDETVLRRPPGGPEVLKAQVEYLIKAMDLPNVTLQVLAFSAGLHPGAFGPFTLFRFPIKDFPDIICTDNLSNAKYSEEQEEVALHREVFDRISAQAMSKGRTREFLLDLCKELDR
ncbi:helix-turn-helix domain-containing protein [Streptomyces fulvoviolaceus]|uniref:helix-turn-helix domain-containing protein n=1 Tax=Streptomyces fulvoviolaceus TaxID=285535 RepID=UPI0021BF88A2|nr:helix-turn-helix transcriptional regulator [Streptomyces fulvoviolaceus]MCT9080473.1 helix-turn-helix domain-containing protein [Streptomyces fulvoviolaceus]